MTPEQMASGLISALDEVLDLDSGLADARLPDLRSALVHSLADVLDLDAGLANIKSPPVAALGPGRDIAGLSGFAIWFRELPADERLAARRWFPLEGLRILRSLSLARLDIRTIRNDLAKGAMFNGARITSVVDRVRGIQAAANSIRRQLRYPPLEGDVFVDIALGNSLDGAREIAAARNYTRARFLTSVVENNLGIALGGVLVMVRLLAKQRADAEANLATVLDHAFATHVLTNSNLGDRLMVTSIDRMEDSLSNVIAAELSHVDLRGIPLEGLRWSRTTSWPPEWREQVRDNSVEIKPGVYEVRFGGVSVDLMG